MIDKMSKYAIINGDERTLVETIPHAFQMKVYAFSKIKTVTGTMSRKTSGA